MLVADPRTRSQYDVSAPLRAARRLRPEIGRRIAPAVTFLGAAALLLAFALPGGTYDVVLRQEYGIALWWILGLGFALGLLPRTRPSRVALLLLAALFVYALWTAASLGWTSSSERTTSEVARVLEYLALIALIVSTVDRTTWTAAAMGFAVAALLVCALALASRLAPAAFPSNPLYLPHSTNRLGYPFGYWNAVGAWAAMSTAIALAWSAHDPMRLRRAAVSGTVPIALVVAYLSYSRAAVAGTALAVIVVIAFSRNRLTALVHAVAAGCSTAIVIIAVRNAPEIAQGAGSRGGGSVLGAVLVAICIASLAGALTSVAAPARVHRRLHRKRLPAAAAVVAIAIAIAGGILVAPLAGKAWQQFRHPNVAQSASDPASRFTNLGGGRYYFWRAAFEAFTARPLTGTGAGTYEFWWDQHATDSEFIRNAHSLELDNMAELGVPGALLIAAVIGTAVAVLAIARRQTRRSLSTGASTALLACFLVYVLHASVDWMWQSTAVSVLALGAAAIAAGRLERGHPRKRGYLRAGVAVAAVAAIGVQVPGLLATLQIRRSQDAERAGNALLAYAWAGRAISSEPWAAAPYEQRGLVLESAGRLAEAQADIQRAVAREPSNFMHWLLLARVETERGELVSAAQSYARARGLRPKALTFAYAPYFSGLTPAR